MMSGKYPVEYKRVSHDEHHFDIVLGDDQYVHLKTFKDLVAIRFSDVTSKDFQDSVGLMGTFEKGTHVGRDGTTIFMDDNAFGMEWAVGPEDPQLFTAAHTNAGQCKFPGEASNNLRRRLGENGVSKEAAELACAHLTNGRVQCVYDVMVTGDLSVAQGGGF